MPTLACADASPSYASEPRIAIAYVTLCVLALAVRLGLIATLVRLRTAACSAQHGLLRPDGCDPDPTLSSFSRESLEMRLAVAAMQRGAAVTLLYSP